MNRVGGLWRWVICALPLGGCSARTELDPYGGETGPGSAAGRGSGGNPITAGSGGAGADSGKAGGSGKAGFRTFGHTLTLDDGLNLRSYEYCSSAGKVTLRPLSTANGTLQGAIVLAPP